MVSSAPELLALHGVRVLGSPSIDDVAGLFDLPAREVADVLLDAEASGWARHHAWYGSTSWSLTDAGKAENERQLAAELDAVEGARFSARTLHLYFLDFNERHVNAVTRWQFNAGVDARVDKAVLRELGLLDAELRRICSALSRHVNRFGVHPPRHRAALDRVRAGDRAWLDAPGRASCHLAWMSFHEDLVATLGIERGAEESLRSKRR